MGPLIFIRAGYLEVLIQVRAFFCAARLPHALPVMGVLRVNMKQFGTDLHAGAAELRDGARRLLVDMRHDVRDTVEKIRAGVARKRGR